MLTDFYIEALLVDEELADQAWESWDKGEIDGQVAWWLITYDPLGRIQMSHAPNKLP